MRTEGSREYHAGCYLSTNRDRARAHHSALYAERTHSSLAGRVHLHLLPDYRTRFLVSLYVLAGHAGGWRPDGSLLASVAWVGVHAFDDLDVQDVARRHGYDGSGPALVERDEVLH